MCDDYLYVSTWLAMGYLDYNISLSVSVRVFLNAISIWIAGLSKAACSAQCGGHCLTHGGPEQNKRGQKEGFTPFIFCVSAWMGTSHLTFSSTQTWVCFIGSPASQNFGLRLDLCHQLPWGSTLQISYHGTSQPPQWHEPVPHNKSPYVYICIYRYISYYSVYMENPDSKL